MKPKKIKILYTIPNFDTAGSGKVVYDLVRNLDKSIFEPEICCFHDSGDFFKVIESLGVKIHVFAFTTSYRPFLTFPFRLLKVIRFLKKEQFDLIHSWHWSSDFSEPLAAKLAGIPFVYTKKAMGWGNKAWRWRTALSSKVIAINSDMKRLFFEDFKTKIAEIPLGIDTDYFSFQKKKAQIVDDLKFMPNDFVIISVANLLPIKGIELLIKAVLELNDSQIKLVLVGNDTGKYAEELKELAKSSVNIIFTKKQLDVRPYHAVSDLIVISTLSLGEGLPVAPLEAMSSGRVVIGSNVSGVKDILKTFSHCIFEPENVESLKNKILEIKNLSKQDRLQLGKNMRVAVQTHFSKEAFISSHEKLYLDLVK